MDKPFTWSPAKNAWLLSARGISFEEIVFHIMNGGLVDVVPSENPERYPGQLVFLVLVEEYIHLVPFDETADEIKLQTIIPSRKATKRYRRGEP